jgi:hypothetical protein
MSEASIQSISKLLGIGDPLDNDIMLTVQPVVYGRFGVFANAVHISIHESQGDADAHLQRLHDQQLGQ